MCSFHTAPILQRRYLARKVWLKTRATLNIELRVGTYFFLFLSSTDLSALVMRPALSLTNFDPLLARWDITGPRNVVVARVCVCARVENHVAAYVTVLMCSSLRDTKQGSRRLPNKAHHNLKCVNWPIRAPEQLINHSFQDQRQKPLIRYWMPHKSRPDCNNIHWLLWSITSPPKCWLFDVTSWVTEVSNSPIMAKIHIPEMVKIMKRCQINKTSNKSSTSFPFSITSNDCWIVNLLICFAFLTVHYAGFNTESSPVYHV